MKNKLYTLILTSIILLVSHNLNSIVRQQSHEDMYDNLLMPIDLSPAGLSQFLKHSYNNTDYAAEILPHNFDHLVQFLEYGKTSQQPRSYEQLVFRLFKNKLNACSYVNAGAFSSLLSSMPPLMDSYFVSTKRADLHVLQEQVNSLLYNSFLDRFSHFKRNPNLFLNDLSQEIVKTLSKEPEHLETTVDELRKTTLVFLETALSKLIWSPEDSVETWNSVKRISEQLGKLVDHKIIGDSEDLNDLYVTLLERYCFFIDLASNHLPVSFYEEVKKDISAKKPALLSLAEQDEMIETKETRLRRTLAHGEQYARQIRQKELLDTEVKALAGNHGILVR